MRFESASCRHHLVLNIITQFADFNQSSIRYLRDGRYKKTNNDYVFISTKAPYGSISISVCESALKRAGTSTRKFHQTRKTYGSDILRNGATIAETAEIFSHSDTSTVHKYMSLDTERMWLCPLSMQHFRFKILKSLILLTPLTFQQMKQIRRKSSSRKHFLLWSFNHIKRTENALKLFFQANEIHEKCLPYRSFYSKIIRWKKTLKI